MKKGPLYCKNLGQSLIYKQAGANKKRRLTGDLTNVEKVLVYLFHHEETKPRWMAYGDIMVKALNLNKKCIRAAVSELQNMGLVGFEVGKGWVTKEPMLKYLVPDDGRTTEEYYTPLPEPSILDKLKTERIVGFWSHSGLEPEYPFKGMEVLEMCDQHFGTHLTKEQAQQLANELQVLVNQIP